MKRILVETLLILILSLFLALAYNAVSPSGLRILPKKESDRPKGNTTWKRDIGSVAADSHV